MNQFNSMICWSDVASSLFYGLPFFCGHHCRISFKPLNAIQKKSLFLFHFSSQFLWFTDYFSIFIFSLLLFYSKKNQLIDFINFENELLKLPCDSVNVNHSCTSTVFYFHFIRRVIHNSKFIGMLHNLNTIKPINELIKKFCTPLLRIFFTYLMHSKCLNAYSCLPSQVIKAISNYKSITIVMLHTLTPNTPSR